ncbi:hypothetical protein ABH892_003398 [Paenibacillus sp. RC254]
MLTKSLPTKNKSYLIVESLGVALGSAAFFILQVRV